MNDVINREDAIDAVLGIGHTAKLNDGDTVVRMSAVNYVLRNLPSAQPEPCEDAVSREAVTDVIRHSDIFSTWYEMDDTDDIVAEVIDEARKQLVDDVNELPSVTPKCPECDDAVSREAAIDAAENAFVRGLLASPDIRRLPSVQPEQRWIPCSERLPEYGVAVLTYDRHCFCVEKRIPTIRDDEGEPITGDWWVSDDYDEYDGDYYPNLRDGACIAWMPLPTAYREDGGE